MAALVAFEGEKSFDGKQKRMGRQTDLLAWLSGLEEESGADS